MWRKNLIFMLGILIFLLLLGICVTGYISWLVFLGTVMALIAFVLILYNLDNIESLLIERGKILVKIRKIQSDIYAKKEEIERMRNDVRDLVELLAEPLSFSINKVGRLVDENTFDMEVDIQRENISKLQKRLKKMYE